jgi:hypothetical protein
MYTVPELNSGTWEFCVAHFRLTYSEKELKDPELFRDVMGSFVLLYSL